MRFHLSTLLILSVFIGACVGGVMLYWDVWRLETSLPIKRDHPFLSESIAVSSSGRYLAVVNNNVSIYDLKSKTLLSRWPGKSNLGTCARFTVDEKGIEIVGWNRNTGGYVDTYRVNPNFDPWPQKSDGYNGVAFESILVAASAPFCNTLKQIASAPDRPEHLFMRRTDLAVVVSGDSRPLMVIATSVPVCATYYDQSRGIAVRFDDRVELWRRTREYGLRGWLELPLTWVALVSFGVLVVILVRWIRDRSSIHFAATPSGSVSP